VFLSRVLGTRAPEKPKWLTLPNQVQKHLWLNHIG